MPLVSIVTRTLGRPTLADAAACVRDQTYRPIEWVVVDAAGGGVAVPAAGDLTVRRVGTNARLQRAAAANVGLAAAAGQLLLILDDDDLILPEHVQGLVGALDANPSRSLAYADVAVQDESGETVGVYAWDYSRLHLTRQNLFPPHAALFNAAFVRDYGCRVDETHEYFEDWDLWLQASRYSEFVHHPHTTAVYRSFLSQSGVAAVGTPDADPRCDADLARIQRRYADVRRVEEDKRDRVKRDALAAQSRGNLGAAAALWRKAYGLDTADVEVLVQLAAIALRTRDYTVAANEFARAARIAPRAPEIHWYHAFALDALGKHSDAEAARVRAVALDPQLEAKMRERRRTASTAKR